ncbi:hypothetical protein N5A56_009165 [Polaribacter sp. MSW5]|uniref:Uncharacterized protein n=1 Tax=Polaribacter ponticola TaxID=2978475 RepID=A0ABT5S8Y1_9FLAO|nr:hypothetical protein [Polaribacter sp. MSW5]MDD7914577.1 hypothetical protein [Polaribacter sp. MSW5]
MFGVRFVSTITTVPLVGSTLIFTVPLVGKLLSLLKTSTITGMFTSVSL